MKADCFRSGVTVALLTLCLSVSAFVPQPFFAPMSLAQAQEQAMRQYAAAQGIDVTDVPAGQLTTEKVIARMSEKIKRESGPRADAVVQQYMLSESDFAAALQRADAPEELLSLRTDLQQRMCQIVYGCSQVGCSNEDAVKRAMPAMEQLGRIGKKIEQLSSADRAKFDTLDKALQAQLQARNEALRAVNNQILNNLIQQTSQPLPLYQTGGSGGSGVTSRRKSFKSVGKCPLHGDYDMAFGCPGCKGNVDYGSGKQMYCSKHNLSFDSSIGCPLCNRIGDEGRLAPTWR